MKFSPINLTQRLIVSNLLSLLIVSFAVFMVIRSLHSVESTLKTETTSHVSDLIVNSEISRRVFALTSRVKLLEQTFLFSSRALYTPPVTPWSLRLHTQKMKQSSNKRIPSAPISNAWKNSVQVTMSMHWPKNDDRYRGRCLD